MIELSLHGNLLILKRALELFVEAGCRLATSQSSVLNFCARSSAGRSWFFVESVALSMKRGGILSLTATDTAPLSGTYPKTCIRRYGSRPLRNEFKHEVGIRILVKKVIELGAQHDIAMIPMFAYSHLHYFKLFFMKDRGAKLTNSLIDQFGYVLYCFNCLNREAVSDVLKDEELTDFIYREAQEREEVSRETKRITALLEKSEELRCIIERRLKGGV